MIVYLAGIGEYRLVRRRHRRSMIAGSADSLGERAGPSSRDFHEVRIGADLVEYGQEALGFGEKPMVHV